MAYYSTKLYEYFIKQNNLNPIAILRFLLQKFKERRQSSLSLVCIFRSPRPHESLCDKLLSTTSKNHRTLVMLADIINEYPNKLHPGDEFTKLLKAFFSGIDSCRNGNDWSHLASNFILDHRPILRLIRNKDILNLFQCNHFHNFVGPVFEPYQLFHDDIINSKEFFLQDFQKKFLIQLKTAFVDHDIYRLCEISDETYISFVLYLKYLKPSACEMIIDFLLKKVNNNIFIMSLFKDIVSYMTDHQKQRLQDIFIGVFVFEIKDFTISSDFVRGFRLDKLTNDSYLSVQALIKSIKPNLQFQFIHKLVNPWNSYDLSKPYPSLNLLLTYICGIELTPDSWNFLFKKITSFEFDTKELCIIELGGSIPKGKEEIYYRTLLLINDNKLIYPKNFLHYPKNLLNLLPVSPLLKTYTLTWLNSDIGFETNCQLKSDKKIFQAPDYHEMYVYIALAISEFNPKLINKIERYYDKIKKTSNSEMLHHLLIFLVNIIEIAPDNIELNILILRMLKNHPWPEFEAHATYTAAQIYLNDLSERWLQPYPPETWKALLKLLTPLSIHEKLNLIEKTLQGANDTNEYEDTYTKISIIAETIQTVDEFNFLYEKTRLLASNDHMIFLINAMCKALSLNCKILNDRDKILNSDIPKSINLIIGLFNYRKGINQAVYLKLIDAAFNSFVFSSVEQKKKLKQFIIDSLIPYTDNLIYGHDATDYCFKKCISTHSVNTLLKLATHFNSQELYRFIEEVKYKGILSQMPADLLPRLNDLVISQVIMKQKLIEVNPEIFRDEPLRLVLNYCGG